jgi:hypothetical protein
MNVIWHDDGRVKPDGLAVVVKTMSEGQSAGFGGEFGRTGRPKGYE